MPTARRRAFNEDAAVGECGLHHAGIGVEPRFQRSVRDEVESLTKRDFNTFFWRPGSDPVAWLHDTDAAWINVYGNIHFLKVGAVYLSRKKMAGYTRIAGTVWNTAKKRAANGKLFPTRRSTLGPLKSILPKNICTSPRPNTIPASGTFYRARIANGDEGVMQRLTKEDGTAFSTTFAGWKTHAGIVFIRRPAADDACFECGQFRTRDPL